MIRMALLMVRAFQRADVYAPLPLLKTGEEAIAYLSAAAPFENRDRFPLPSLLILDCNLPKKSGLDVLEWIGTRPELSRMPVVMLSSSTDPNQINRAYELGVKSYLVKPTGFSGLVELLLGLRSSWGTKTENPES
jgi:DNA-binding response OmpR family regulator